MMPTSLESLLPDVKKKIEYGYGCTIHPLDKKYLECIEGLKENNVNASIALRYPVENLTKICESASAAGIGLEVDMRQQKDVDATIEMYKTIKRYDPNATLCLQSYLPRTLNDLENLKEIEPRIRLVKGAFKAEEAYKTKEEINENFKTCAKYCVNNWIQLVIGTHDEKLIEELRCDIPAKSSRMQYQFLYDGTKIGEELKGEREYVNFYLMYGPPLKWREHASVKNIIRFFKSLVGK